MFSGLENPLHLLILLTIVLILFGAKRLPELGRAMGSSLRQFRSGLAENDDDEFRAPERRALPASQSPSSASSAVGLDSGQDSATALGRRERSTGAAAVSADEVV